MLPLVGVEIREPLVVRANMWRDEQQLRNLHYIPVIFFFFSVSDGDARSSGPAGQAAVALPVVQAREVALDRRP